MDAGAYGDFERDVKTPASLQNKARAWTTVAGRDSCGQGRPSSRGKKNGNEGTESRAQNMENRGRYSKKTGETSCKYVFCSWKSGAEGNLLDTDGTLFSPSAPVVIMAQIHHVRTVATEVVDDVAAQLVLSFTAAVDDAGWSER
jgi:hypothetical protein